VTMMGGVGEDGSSQGEPDEGRSVLDWISLMTGFASIASFVCVQAPQIVKNIVQVFLIFSSLTSPFLLMTC